MAELLRHLNKKVWLVGQSLGSVVAQVIAFHHPEVVEGLVLSNTYPLTDSVSKTRYQDLMQMVESRRKFKKCISFLPFPLIKRMMMWAVMKKENRWLHNPEKSRYRGTVRHHDGTSHQTLRGPHN